MKIRLAVFFDQRLHAGGGFQQALNAALVTSKIPSELATILYFTYHKENIPILQSYDLNPFMLHISFFDKIYSRIRSSIKQPLLLRILKLVSKYSCLEAQFIRHNIDLVYFLSPSPWARTLENLCYIFTVWDLCHRDHPEFPEVYSNREFEYREQLINSTIPRAIATISDSYSTKQKLFQRYGIDLDRIHVIPFQPAPALVNPADDNKSVNVTQKHNLDHPYIFYPAQFWPHKNHIYLIDGIHLLESMHNIKISAVFTGSDKSNQQHVTEYAMKLGLQKRIRFAGFVPNDELRYYYLQSLALVMPSYFGPTNLPPLEAFELGVPILYPNLDGMAEQVGNAALLIDINDPHSLANHLKLLITDTSLRKRLIVSGYEQLSKINTISRSSILSEIITKFSIKRSCWY
ncbi:glycosyltransferase family 4 protein [Synechococcus sp. MIT S9451]|uniref:glycosyltransferase family 4 protein n=1 Tax=Synechococcus sp. MIT S9451 TaxID=3082543 RepID=UPI0039B42B46